MPEHRPFRFARLFRRILLGAAALLVLLVVVLYLAYGRLLASVIAWDHRDDISRQKAQERVAHQEWMSCTNGMIAATTGGPAVQAGLQVLRDGGNAADAALATTLVEVVHAGGSYVSFGGVFVALYYDAASGRVYSLNACYSAPAGEQDPLSIPDTGGRTVLVPGFMAGIQAMHDRFGKMPLGRVFAPAIDLARNGEPVNGWLAWMIHSKKSVLSRFPETKKIFTNDKGQFYGINLFGGADVFRQPELAMTLSNVASQGASYMYTGDWARRFVDAVQKDGGKITMNDLRDYKVEWKDAFESTYRDYRLFVVNLPSEGGIQLVEGLNLLELADMKKRGHWTNSADSLYWFCRIAGCDNQLGSSPTINGRALSPESRVTRETSRWIWEQMQNGTWPGMAKAGTNTPAGGNHSASLVVVDRWGNIAAITHSINTDSWGQTGLFVDGVSIPDSARFHRQDSVKPPPNRHLESMPSPLIIFRGNRPALACSGIGSGFPKMLQVVVNILDFGIKPQAAVNTPAFEGPLFSNHGLILTAHFQPHTFGTNVLDQLQAMGIKVNVSSEAFLNGYWSGIQIDPATGRMMGAVSQRLDEEDVAVP